MNYSELKLENQLCFPLYVASKEVIKKYKPFLDPINLTYTQYIVMLVMWEHETISIKELGNMLYLDSGTLSPLIKKLEQLNYVCKLRDKNDQRIVKLSITPLGLKLQDKAKDIPKKIGKCLNLNQDELKVLYNLLYKTINNL